MNQFEETREDKETIVLGYLLNGCRDGIPEAVGRLIEFAPESFSDGRHAAIAGAIKELLRSDRPVTLVSVKTLLAGAVDTTLLMDVFIKSEMPVSIVEDEAKTLLNAFRDTQIAHTFQEAKDQLEKNPRHALTVARHAIKSLQTLEGATFGRAAALEKLKARRFDPAKVPAPLRAIYSLAGVPISTPGNLSVIAAHAKTGKTAFVGGLIAATMNPTLSGPECLGITSIPNNGKAVVHFDSEQAPDDHWWLIDRSKKRAKASAVPEWLRTYCLTGLSAPECWTLIKLELDEASQTCGGIHSVLIDGGADLVSNVNDPEECNAFAAELQGLAIKYDCPIMVVIHFNPNGEKTRGHLGSQLERKAETNLTLKKTGEITEIFSTKQRRAPILEGQGPKFAWSDEHGMHMSVGEPAKDPTSAKIYPYLDEVFEKPGGRRYSEIISTVMSVAEIKKRSAERWIEEAVSLGALNIGAVGIYTRGTYGK